LVLVSPAKRVAFDVVTCFRVPWLRVRILVSSGLFQVDARYLFQSSGKRISANRDMHISMSDRFREALSIHFHVAGQMARIEDKNNRNRRTVGR
jgi:hypothetical protein